MKKSSALATVPKPASITIQPLNRVVSVGGSFALTVGAGDSGPLLHQGRLNRAGLAGATNVTLDISNVLGSQAGAYDVLVAMPDGTVATERTSVLVTIFDVRPAVSLLGAEVLPHTRPAFGEA